MQLSDEEIAVEILSASDCNDGTAGFYSWHGNDFTSTDGSFTVYSGVYKSCK